MSYRGVWHGFLQRTMVFRSKRAVGPGVLQRTFCWAWVFAAYFLLGKAFCRTLSVGEGSSPRDILFCTSLSHSCLASSAPIMPVALTSQMADNSAAVKRAGRASLQDKEQQSRVKWRVHSTTLRHFCPVVVQHTSCDGEEDSPWSRLGVGSLHKLPHSVATARSRSTLWAC